MSFLDDLFGSNDPIVQQTNNEPPAYLRPGLEELVGRARTVSNEQYIPYDGQRIQDFSQDELTAQNQVRNLFGGNSGGMSTLGPGSGGAPGMKGSGPQFGVGESQELTRRGTQGFGQADANRLMSPYISSVIERSQQEARRQSDISRQALGQRQAAAGAFGGSRHGIQEAELERTLQRELTDINTSGLQNAYTNAQNQFNQEQGRNLQGGNQLAQYAQQGQTMGLQGAAALEASGAGQRNMGQRGLDTAYQDFLGQREYPREQVSYLSNILQRLPNQPQTTQTTTQQPQPILSQLAGAGLGLAAISGAFKRGGPVKGYSKGGRVGDYTSPRIKGYAEGGQVGNSLYENPMLAMALKMMQGQRGSGLLQNVGAGGEAALAQNTRNKENMMKDRLQKNQEELLRQQSIKTGADARQTNLETDLAPAREAAINAARMAAAELDKAQASVVPGNASSANNLRAAQVRQADAEIEVLKLERLMKPLDAAIERKYKQALTNRQNAETGYVETTKAQIPIDRKETADAVAADRSDKMYQGLLQNRLNGLDKARDIMSDDDYNEKSFEERVRVAKEWAPKSPTAKYSLELLKDEVDSEIEMLEGATRKKFKGKDLEDKLAKLEAYKALKYKILGK